MTEREAFDAFCRMRNPKYRKTDDSVMNREEWRIWQEACAWQRKKDELICDGLDKLFGLGPAKAIREQVPNA